jgi:transcriptional regulator of acetoin/glycerol metabolism
MVDNNEFIIKMSHKRCQDYGVEKEMSCSSKILNKEDLNKVLKNNKELIEVAIQYINMINSALNGQDFIIILTDNEGCILYIDGDFKILSEFSKVNFIVGAYMDEKSVGTNAMGTAIKEDKPIQITAKEHYIEAFHVLTCSAAPIHDCNGNVIGSLNLTSTCDKKHPHTLGLVVLAVKAIENEIDKNNINNILNESYNYMESVLGNVDKGIVIVDMAGRIKNINKLGEKIFNKHKDDLINEEITYIVPEWYNIIEGFENGNSSYTKEIKLKHSSKYKTILNFKPVRIKEKVIGLVITMKDEKEVIYNSNLNTGAFYNFDDIIGDSAVIQNIITNCKIISNSPSTVLIEGESGTGKELLAQSIHNYSYRKNKKFVAINCGAIPVNLIESELFGYEDGTFTGGRKGGKCGKFELANGGTLFLDEIGEMPLDMQVKLLRVLEEGRIIRLGGEIEIPVDIRVIAATNKDLKEEIVKGNFREDLYYRLCVIPIKVPPLRERKGDIESLINYFLRIKAFKLDKNVPIIDQELKNKLLSYTWPGNIRELENYIENLVNLDGKVSSDYLMHQKSQGIISKSTEKSYQQMDNICSLQQMEKQMIKRAIEVCNSNMSKVAKNLGISRNTLYAKIKKYNIV